MDRNGPVSGGINKSGLVGDEASISTSKTHTTKGYRWEPVSSTKPTVVTSFLPAARTTGCLLAVGEPICGGTNQMLGRRETNLWGRWVCTAAGGSKLGMGRRPAEANWGWEGGSGATPSWGADFLGLRGFHASELGDLFPAIQYIDWVIPKLMAPIGINVLLKHEKASWSVRLRYGWTATGRSDVCFQSDPYR
jgi:hypothetical protein